MKNSIDIEVIVVSKCLKELSKLRNDNDRLRVLHYLEKKVHADWHQKEIVEGKNQIAIAVPDATNHLILRQD